MKLDENPVRRARLSLNLGRAEFCLKTGLTVSQVSGAENGYIRQIPSAWEPALAALGLVHQQIADEYKAWRASQAAGPAVVEG